MVETGTPPWTGCWGHQDYPGKNFERFHHLKSWLLSRVLWGKVRTSGVLSSHCTFSEFSIKVNTFTFISFKFLEINEMTCSFWTHLSKLQNTFYFFLFIKWAGIQGGGKDFYKMTYSLIPTSIYHLIVTSFLRGLFVFPCSFTSYLSFHGLIEACLEPKRRTSFGMFP